MTSENRQMMIYGANGYTGELIAIEAVGRGFKPVLAGRNKQAISQLAESLNLTARVFGLNSVEQVIRQLKDIHLVIHCAGPFSATAESMMQACISSNTHYTDITGEISVFERAQGLNADAKSANIVLCPGVGFDIIPTDCIASQLKEKMPDAVYLALGFDADGGMSPGTSKTMVEG
ncbi:MAG: saccharopine dehydrogenase NADP-binding domain-containing protein, partial [Proteobacteria bacterium]|nr:saccharopine dehydrogenase NADP-binding domain-containing protein [Pseudomonadota bacterium]